MAYSKKGKRAFEYANKAAHSHIISDDVVKDFLRNCKLPKRSEDVTINEEDIESVDDPENIIEENPIEHVVVIDGSFSTVPVYEKYPSSEFTFFQFGALKFSLSYLEEISEQHFVGPEDISRLKDEFGRIKLAVPTKNITYRTEFSLLNSIRKAIFEFFLADITYEFFDNSVNEKFIDTFQWLIFEEYKSPSSPSYQLGSCPHCRQSKIDLLKNSMADYTFKCPYCNELIYLTDVLRLHELIDEDLGANGIIFMLLRTLEQLLLVLIIKIVLNTNPDLLGNTLFIQDGPLALFGQTAKLYASMEKLVKFLFENHDLFLIGLEKHGAFAEHAEEISHKLNPREILVLDTNYIYTYIKNGDPTTTEPFGRSTYYGNKLVFKSKDNKVYVATLPMKKNLLAPKKSDFKNIDIILANIEYLKCELYDDAILPIVLVNRLVSLSDRPGSAILGKFAKREIGN